MAVTFKIAHMSTAPLIRQFPSYYRSILNHSINDVAFQARRDLGNHASRVFSNPRDLTKNAGEVVKKSEPDTLQAKIGLRDFVGKGTAPDVYLRPQVHGSFRNHKRFEKALLARIPQFGPNTFFVPASQNKEFLDPAGMVKGSVIVQMLSHLQAFGEQGYKANIKNPKRALYFAVPYRSPELSMLHPGIYKRDAIGSDFFKAVFYAVKSQPMYRKRFYYFETVKKTIRKVFPMSFARRFQRVAAAKHVRTYNLTQEKILTRAQRQSRLADAISSNRRVMQLRRSFGITRTRNVLEL
tara:strand:- start:728 stop:1615 length:888 start_codon:yes stop_codon:yes gene_type:complete